MNKSNQEPDWQRYVEEINLHMAKNGITQVELAKRTGMIQSGISRILSFQYTPKFSTIILILEALNLEIKIVDKDDGTEPIA